MEEIMIVKFSVNFCGAPTNKVQMQRIECYGAVERLRLIDVLIEICHRLFGFSGPIQFREFVERQQLVPSSISGVQFATTSLWLGRTRFSISASGDTSQSNVYDSFHTTNPQPILNESSILSPQVLHVFSITIPTYF